MRTLLIGDMKSVDAMYPWLAKAEEAFDIVGIVTGDEQSSSEFFQCPIVGISQLAELEYSFECIFIMRDFYERVSRILNMLGVDANVIKLENQICDYLGKSDRMAYYREYVRDYYQSKYVNELITVGDFSYGIPEIRYFGNDSHLSIGKFCSIGRRVHIMLSGDHNVEWCSTYPFNDMMTGLFPQITGQPKTKGDVVIGNDVWLADDVKIMSGITIGDGAVVSANAVVTKDVPPYAVVGGVPARVIKMRFPQETIEKLEKLKWWDWSDEKLYDAIPLLQSGDIEELLKMEE